MNEKQKDEFNGTEDKFAELGQQAGVMLGQLFSAAEKFGHQVSKESQSQASQEPFVSALREAGEEFRATATRAAESLSGSFRHGSTDPDNADENVADADDVSPGNVRKIGGAARESTQPMSERGSSGRSSAGDEQVSANSVATDRARQLAEIFHSDHELSDLTSDEFDALKTLLEKHYRGIREFQGHK